METIFDHNVTPKELEILFGVPDVTKEEYLQNKEDNQHWRDRCFGLIYNLYRIRKNRQKQIEYANKVSPSDWKWFTLLNNDH